ncbi:MAG: class I SAM-dependent methyltransferase, partial [candidate division Zixibacteria bacterium]|nr:class I SAM-dependent methyltransferase [candidate division Zixibacteria bacterium]MBU1470873.1 class I SAM-dependent methyltransferase [candidate division Zixibacteria bacterium]
RFDMIILDPPAFCKSKTAIVKACRGYKDINRIAMQLLSPNGILVSCSCSRPVSDELFMKVLWQASVEANRDAQLLSLTGQSPDHPVLLTFPESKYLKCATLLVQ